MIPQPVTDEMVLEYGEGNAVKRTFVGPAGMDNVAPCEAVVHRSPTDGETAVIRVPMHLEPGELTKLLAGGTVWVSMWGGLSPFAVEVVSSDQRMGHAEKALQAREREALERSVS